MALACLSGELLGRWQAQPAIGGAAELMIGFP